MIPNDGQAGSGSLASEALDRLDRFRSDMRKISEGFDDFILIQGMGSGEVGFGDAYLNNRLWIAVFFDVGDQEFLIVLTPGGESSDNVAHVDSVVATQFGNVKPMDVCGQNQVSVLVRICERIDGPYREVIGLGRLYLVEDVRSERPIEVEDFFVGLGPLKLRLLRINWEMNPSIRVSGVIHDLASNVIKAGSESLRACPSQKPDARIDGREVAENAKAQFFGFGVMLGNDFTSLFLNVADHPIT
jgi:hypothetical protein